MNMFRFAFPSASRAKPPRMSRSKQRVAGTRRALRDACLGDPRAVAAQLADLARFSIRIHIQRRADAGYRLALTALRELAAAVRNSDFASARMNTSGCRGAGFKPYRGAPSGLALSCRVRLRNDQSARDTDEAASASLPVQDPWFAVSQLSPGLFRITEPRCHRWVRANSFLILGRERDILVGQRDGRGGAAADPRSAVQPSGRNSCSRRTRTSITSAPIRNSPIVTSW